MDIQNIIIQLVIVFILILLSAFFSSAETSMTKVNLIRIQSLAEEGDKRAIRLSKILASSQKMLSTILIGNNIVNMAVSALLTSLTIRLLGNAYVGLATGILTLVILVFGEITPKTMASLESEKMALSYSGAVWIMMLLLTPAVWLVGRLGDAVMHLFGIDPDGQSVTVTENEIRTMMKVGEQGGTIENGEKQMIDNVFDFGDFRAKDVMIPRIDMTCVDVKSTYEELVEIFRRDLHTRFPVFENDTDNVIGIINVKDLILVSHEAFSIRDILREPYFTYEQKPTKDLLVEMRRAGVSIAIVLDEYGATAGLVTLEDLLEEIVGEIRDEYDQDETDDLEEVIPGREYVAKGGTKLSAINNAFHLELESADNDSIGGYLMEKLDRLAKEGDHIELPGGVRVIVDDMDRNRIEHVHIWLSEEKQGEG